MSHRLSSPALLRFALWLLLCVPLTGSALGLGDIHVRSAMGQKLEAEIEFSALTAVEAESLTIRLASPETFVQAGIEYQPVLRSLRFSVEKKGDRQVVRLNSDLVISDPFLTFLIELNAAGNRTLRQYSLLLDPPAIAESPVVVNAPETDVKNGGKRDEKAGVIAETKTVPSAETPLKTPTPAKAATPTTTPTTSTSSPTSTASPTSESTSAPASAPTKIATHTVKRGETLAGIAAAKREEGVSLNQMLLALQRENAQAFAGNNINRLKAGSVLRMPDAEAMRAVDPIKARDFIRAQHAEFQRYREQLAQLGAPKRDVAAAVNPDADARQNGIRSSSGTVTQKSQEAAAAPVAQDKLKLTAPVPDKLSESDKPVAAAAKAGRSTVTQGKTGNTDKEGADTLDKIAADKAVADANARIAALEKNISDMQQLADIQSKSLADKQDAATTPPQTAAPTAAPTRTTAPTTVPTAQAISATPTLAAKTVSKTSPRSEPVRATDGDVVSFFHDLLQDSTLMLAGIAGTLLLLLTWLGLRFRRRKQSPEEKTLEADGMQSVFEHAGGRNIDTSNSVFHSNFVPSVSQLDTNEVDAVAEADVYIAYGRDEQAEEILQDALRLHPDRHALRVKLLEIYATRKDRQKFGTLAAELRVLTHGVGEAWAQAAQMGMVLDPGNLLYGAALRNDHGEFAAASLKPGAVQPATSSSSVEDFEVRLEGLLDERRNDTAPQSLTPTLTPKLTPTTTVPAGGYATSARMATQQDTSGNDSGIDLSNALEFNLSDSFTSSLTLSTSTPSISAPATALKAVSPGGKQIDLASLNTKLDLAIACQEIGDHEGARELLTEVAGGPDAGLAQRAQSLLSQLA